MSAKTDGTLGSTVVSPGSTVGSLLVQPDFLIKTLIIGDSGVGKSCLLKRFACGEFAENHYATIGVDFEIRTLDLGGKLAKLQIWDTAGQERFRNIATSYYRGAHSILLVFDVTNPDSFGNVRNWLREVRQHASDDATVLLIGNKCDLVERRLVTTDDAKKLADDLNLPFLETSAKSAINVERAFVLMAQEWVTHKMQRLASSSRPALSLTAEPLPSPQPATSIFSCCSVQ